MAIKKALGFSMFCLGDGAADQFEFLIETTPFWYAAPDNSFDASSPVSMGVPTDVIALSSPTGGAPNITAGSITTLGTKLKVEFDAAIPDDLLMQINGTFVF